MIRLIDILASGVTDSAGAALSSGTVTFYQAGSTVLETVYEDFALTDPHSNPATLNDAGILVAYTDSRLKLVISDNTGAVVRTIDNVGTADSDVSDSVSISNQVPSGAISAYGGNSAPTGWLICDGSAVNRTTYSSLYSAIGTTWGSGDGVTTFNIPDLRGRTIIGAGTGSGLTARTLGANVGSESVTLTGAQSGTSVHSHSTSETAHRHKVLGNAVSNQSPVADNTSSSISINQAGLTSGQLEGTNSSAGYAYSGATSTSLTVSNSSAADASESHTNMQPSSVINFIIKT